MSDQEATHVAATAVHGAATTTAARADDHAVGDGHDDDHGGGHGHAEESLGPIDVLAWGAGLLGVLLGGVVALVLAMSTELLTF